MKKNRSRPQIAADAFRKLDLDDYAAFVQEIAQRLPYGPLRLGALQDALEDHQAEDSGA